MLPKVTPVDVNVINMKKAYEVKIIAKDFTPLNIANKIAEIGCMKVGIAELEMVKRSLSILDASP